MMMKLHFCAVKIVLLLLMVILKEELPSDAADPDVLLPVSGMINVIPGFRLWCKANGTPPIHTALMWNDEVLANSTGAPRVLLKEEGNYTCTATSQLGTESKSVHVTFATCPRCTQAKGKWYSHWGNTLDCMKIRPPPYINCTSTLAEVLYIHESDLGRLSVDFFESLSNLRFLFLASNNIHELAADVFYTLKNLTQLDLSSNSISVLPSGLFSELIQLSSLNLSSNIISALDGDIFSSLGRLIYLSLSFNKLKRLENTNFVNLSSLQYLDISNNQIEDLPDGLFCCSKGLQYLFLQHNNITALEKDTFSNALHLKYLFLSNNNISKIPEGTFLRHKKLDLLMLSDMNMSEGFGDKAFGFGTVNEGPKGGLKLFMIRNTLPELRIETFDGLKGTHHAEVGREEKQVSVVKYIKSDTREERVTIYLNPTRSETMAIEITAKNYERANLSLVSTFLDLGFKFESENQTEGVEHYEVEPCPTGYYSRGYLGCLPCPPGGYMSDTVSFVSEGCKKCPRGTSVRLKLHPGKKRMDCKACPRGTDTGIDSNKFMACRCLPSFHRTDIFDKCFHCYPNNTRDLVFGLNCSGDYLDLYQGYWWYWKNDTHRMRFKNFSWNILDPAAAFQDGLGQYVTNFTYPLPERKTCPRETSCPGGWRSIVNPCADGYEGPVCGLCSPGYYREVTACRKCPTMNQIYIKLGTIGAVFLFLVMLVLWYSRKRARNIQQRPMIDKVFSRVRIVVICYQTHYAMLEAFKYVTWNEHIEDVVHYSDVLQLNFLQIVPVNCLFPQIKMDAFGRLFGVMILNAAGTLFFGMLLRLSAVLIWLDPTLTPKQRAKRISDAKGLIYRFLFFFLFVNYFYALSQTANVFPIHCRSFCFDKEETLCDVYLKTDYTVRCTDPYYRLKLIAASLNIVYLIGFPAFCIAVLWRSQWVFLGPEYTYRYTSPQENLEVITGLSFLYEPYRKMLWWWELVDWGRKVFLAFGLILFGKEKRLHIALASIGFSFYAMNYTLYGPLEDFFENSMMTLALSASFLNMGLGALSRIPKENALVPETPDPILISLGFMLYVHWVNTLVLTYIAAEYYVKVWDHIIMWWRRPYLSIDCCQAVLLPYSIDLDFSQPTYKLMDDDVEDQDFKHRIRVEYGIPEMPSMHARAWHNEWLDNIERGKLIQDEVGEEFDLLFETNCKEAVEENNVNDNFSEPDEVNGCRLFKDGELKVNRDDDEVFDFDVAFGSRFLEREFNAVESESTVKKPDNEVKDSPVSVSRRVPNEANVESTKSAVSNFDGETQEFDVADRNGKLKETDVDDSESAFNKADDKIKESPVAVSGGAPIETNVENSECNNKVDDEIIETPVAASSTAANETELKDTETATTKCDDKSHHFNEAAARETIVEDRSSVTKAHVHSEIEDGGKKEDDNNDETNVGREDEEVQTELTLLGEIDDEEIRRMGFFHVETLCESDMKKGVNLSLSNLNSREGDIQTGPNDVECTDETRALLSEHDSEPPEHEILRLIGLDSHDSDLQTEFGGTNSTHENGACQPDIASGVSSITDDLKSAKDDVQTKATNEGWEYDPFELEDNLKQPMISSVDAKSNQDAIYEGNATCRNEPDVDNSLIPVNARVNLEVFREEDLACQNESLIPVNACSHQDSFSGEDNNAFESYPNVDDSLIPDNVPSHQDAFCGENNNAWENDQDVDYSLLTSSHQDAFKGEDNDAFQTDPDVDDSLISFIALWNQDAFCGEDNNAFETDNPDEGGSLIPVNASLGQDTSCGEDNNAFEVDNPHVDGSLIPVHASLHQDTFCGEDNDACENDPDVDDLLKPVNASLHQDNACENDPAVDEFPTFF